MSALHHAGFANISTSQRVDDGLRLTDAYILAALDRSPDDGPIERMTARELQVLELLADGLSNKVIAARLGVSDETVKFHLSAILGKLGVANRTEAVRRAIRMGLVAI